jgi:non-specific serine/threonine protein kinase
MTTYQEAGDKGGTAFCLLLLGRVSVQQGDFPAARAFAAESAALFRELGEKPLLARSLKDLSRLAQREGDCERAAALSAEHLTLSWEVNDRVEVAISLSALARIAGMRGDWARAARLWGAAAVFHGPPAGPMVIDQRSSRHEEGMLVRSALGEAAFTAAWEEGRAMAPEQAVVYALEC